MTAAVAAPPRNVDRDWLANMAQVWVERWLAHGGMLTADPACDHVGIGMRLNSRFWRVPVRHGRRDHLWHDGWKIGRWRELSEMAGYVPGLYGAIVHHVALHGERSLDGSTTMSRTAAEMGVV